MSQATTAAGSGPPPAAESMPHPASAAALGLLRCASCELVLAAPDADAEAGTVARCPRCRAPLHPRKPQSLQRTAAWLLTAVLLYIPANLLPVMSTQTFLGRSSHTLAGGIHDLWVDGSKELALIVFIASLAVPVLKIAALALLAWTAARRSTWRQRERAALYRLVETVGHWSMLDVFVVVLLVGMVRFGALAGVEPETGLLAFGAVVVATMLASSAFDPRLIWPVPEDAEATKRREGQEHAEGAPA